MKYNFHLNLNSKLNACIQNNYYLFRAKNSNMNMVKVKRLIDILKVENFN